MMVEPIICTNCGETTTLEQCKYMYHEKQCSTCGYCIDCEEYKNFDFDLLNNEQFLHERYTEFPNKCCEIIHVSDIHVEQEENNPFYKVMMLKLGLTFQYEVNEQNTTQNEINFFCLVHVVDDEITDTIISAENDNILWKQIQQIFTDSVISTFQEKLQTVFCNFVKERNKDIAIEVI